MGGNLCTKKSNVSKEIYEQHAQLIRCLKSRKIATGADFLAVRLLVNWQMPCLIAVESY